MRINLNTWMIGLLAAGSLLQPHISESAFSQASKIGKDEGIVRISASSVTTLQIEVRAADKMLVIPYCSDAGTAERILYCNEGLEHDLERFDGKRWIRTNPGYPGEILGVEEGKWKPAVIAPGESAIFKFEFNQDFYHLRKGEKLRLRIFAWATAESMTRDDKPNSKFVSPVFVCP